MYRAMLFFSVLSNEVIAIILGQKIDRYDVPVKS